MRLSEERDLMGRLYERLADALRRSRQEPFVAPVTVAEIYQELVPYRTVRDDVGFSMNADYEHALLRLLAGEGEWLQLEPSSARDIIARELKSPNPNVSIYREYAGCDVWVRPPAATDTVDFAQDRGSDLDWLDSIDDEETGVAAFAFAELVDPEDEPEETDEPAEAPAAPAEPPVTGEAARAASSKAGDGLPAAASPAAGEDVAAAVNPAAPHPAAASAPGRARSQTPAAEAAAAPGADAEPARCVFCDSDLPGRRAVRFCPYCGGDQSMRPCGACGEALEAGWSFCVACGAQADAG